jgi:hypothetical protein
MNSRVSRIPLALRRTTVYALFRQIEATTPHLYHFICAYHRVVFIFHREPTISAMNSADSLTEVRGLPTPSAPAIGRLLHGTSRPRDSRCGGRFTTPEYTPRAQEFTMQLSAISHAASTRRRLHANSFGVDLRRFSAQVAIH